MSEAISTLFDVVVVGGGPAGLSAAITLGRACRRVVVLDHGRPRNQPAVGVHCFLGHDGIGPFELRDVGRQEARRYGALLIDEEATSAAALEHVGRPAFEVKTANANYRGRAILLATGVADQLPDIPGLKPLYGRSIHHCPYCDGWEHRGQRLAALGETHAAVELAIALRGWSDRVALCSHGETLAAGDIERLRRQGVAVHTSRIDRLVGVEGVLRSIEFADGSTLECDAAFFSSGQVQRSSLPSMLGCDCDEEGLVITSDKHCTSVAGVYLAGDADGDSQFAIVAAAEGVAAAVAIDQALARQDALER